MIPLILEADDYLFPSTKPTEERPHLSIVRAYQIVRDIGDRLGLTLYDHWFRAQRACQLTEEYQFSLHELMDFFGWKHIETALRYAKLSTESLERKMRPQWFAHSARR